MEIVSDLIKILLPSAITLYAIYLVVKSFLHKEFEKKALDIKMKNTEVVLPIRLQAYERMCLFLERISLQNLVVRVNNPAFNAQQLQQTMILEIREEYYHNLSQQVYMSDNAWETIKNAKEETVRFINMAYERVGPEARSFDLARQIFEIVVQLETEPTVKALQFIKNEIRTVYDF